MLGVLTSCAHFSSNVFNYRFSFSLRPSSCVQHNNQVVNLLWVGFPYNQCCHLRMYTSYGDWCMLSQILEATHVWFGSPHWMCMQKLGTLCCSNVVDPLTFLTAKALVMYMPFFQSSSMRTTSTIEGQVLPSKPTECRPCLSICCYSGIEDSLNLPWMCCNIVFSKWRIDRGVI